MPLARGQTHPESALLPLDTMLNVGHLALGAAQGEDVWAPSGQVVGKQKKVWE